MTDTFVPWSPGLSRISTGAVRAALPVAASPLQAAAWGVNWVLGKGRALAIDGPRTLFAGGEGVGSNIYSYWCNPNQFCADYQVAITMQGQTFDGGQTAIYGSIDIPASGGTNYTFAVDNAISVFYLKVPRTFGASSVEEEFSFKINTTLDPYVSPDNAGQALIVHSVHVYESPQVRLTGNGGTDSYTMEAGDPIYHGAPFASISGLAQQIESASTAYHRRGALFTYTSPVNDALPPNTYPTSFTNMFATPPALQSFLTNNGQTLRTCKVNIRGRVTNAGGLASGSGDVRFTMTNGSTTTFTLSSNTAAWQTPRTISVEVDDPSRWAVDGGIRGGTRDFCTVQIKANVVGHRVHVSGISIYDQP